MDFHALSRRDLQALSKRNGVKANQTNAAMADALAALPTVDGIEEYVQHPVAEPTSAAKPAVQAVAEEEEADAAVEEEERVALTPDEVIVLDDREEEEKAPPTLDVGRRLATRRAPVEPVAAPPAASKRAAARKTEKGDAAAEAVPTRATRGRSQRTVAEEEAPKTARRTSRRAVARNTTTEQEEQEKGTQADVSDVEVALPAPASADEGDDGAEDMETVTDAQNEEQFAAAEAVPARTTRGRGQRTVVSVAEDEAPKARRTSRRAAARKTGTEQEEEEQGTKGGVSEVEAAVPAPASSDEGDDGAAKMEAAMDAQNEEQFAPSEAEKGDASAEVVPARATRAGSRRTVVSFAEEAAPKRRTSRRANGDVSDMETAAPAPVSSDERGDGAMEVAVDAHNEEQNEPVEETVRVEPEVAVTARTTRTRSKRMVSFADEEAPKSRRTSRRAVARKTSSEQEEEGKVTQDDVSDMGAAMSAPASSDEGGDGAEEIEATIDAQKEEQFAVAEAVPARATCARRQRTVVSVTVEEAPKARRTSRRTGTIQEEEMLGQQQEDIASDVEAAVPAPVSSDVGSEGAEEMEPHMEPQNKEQNELVEEQSDEEVVQDRTPLVEEEQPVAKDCQVDSSVEDPVAEDCTVDSSVEEPTDTVSSEEIQHSSEDKEMVPAEEVEITGDASVENEDAEEEPAVAEHIDSSVQEPLVDVQQCEAAEEVHLASEDAEMVPVDEVPEAAHTSDEATQEADHTSDADHDSEENEDCTVEDEIPVADDVDSSVQELPVEVQQCEATEEIQLASENCTVEELPVAEDVQQCEATEDVHLAGEDTEMVHVNEVLQATLKSGEVTEEVHFTSDADEQNEIPTYEEMLETAAKASEEKEDAAADEVTNNTDVAAEEETLVATDEMPQRSQAMDVGVVEVDTVDNLLQATITDDEGTVKESDFSFDLADVSVEEEGVVADDEMTQSPATLDVLILENLSHATVQEVVTVDNLWQTTVTDDECAAKQNGFTGDLMDVSVEEAVAADEMTQMSAIVDECVQEVLILENLSQATLTEDEGAVAADEMLHSTATKDENVEEVVTVENLSQATVTDDEWAVTLSAWLENLSRTKESGVTGDLQPAFDTARDSSDHVASPLSANVFEDATKYLSMDSVTAKPAVSEHADVPPCVYSQSDRKMKSTEPMSVQVKVAKKPEALGSLSRQSLKMKFKADDAPLCIYSNSAGENDVKENNQSEALDSLSLRKLRTEFNEIVAVAQENGVKESKKSSVPLDALSLRQLRLKLKETLNAQNQKNGEPTRVPLGRLDENAY